MDAEGFMVVNNYTRYPLSPTRTTYSLEGLSSTRKHLFSRLKRLNNSFDASKYRNLTLAYETLRSISELLDIPKSLHTSIMVIYQQIVQKRLTRGRRIKELIVALAYLMCRTYGINRPLTEFTQQTQSALPLIRTYLTLLRKTFYLKSKRLSLDYYIEIYCTQLNVATILRTKAFELGQKVKSRGSCPNLRGTAAAILYIIDQKFSPKTSLRQEKLAKVSSVSEVTIRKYAHALAELI
jgi:transcription initiation factor TFIIIB Brf1 subunit/transcription initiation factor TFIIB